MDLVKVFINMVEGCINDINPADKAEKLDSIRFAFSKLSTKCQIVIIRHEYGDSFAEIAKRYGTRGDKIREIYTNGLRRMHVFIH